MTTAPDGRPVVLTGATGYVGKLMAVTLLHRAGMPLILPVRSHHTRDGVLALLAEELASEGLRLSDAQAERLHVIALPEGDDLSGFVRDLKRLGAREMIHAAACLDYFDADGLEETNVRLTRRMLAASAEAGIERFTHISTAFSAGYRDGMIGEQLIDEPLSDPTFYTRTKRAAERAVIGSGLPYLILRPSIVIGHSRTGHYNGKSYGLYQLWSGIERFFFTQWEPEYHVVAPPVHTNFLHQDAYQNAFYAAWTLLRDGPGRIVNLTTTRPEHAPRSRDLWMLWMDRYLKPQRVHFYDSVRDIRAVALPRRQRALIALGSVNLEIAAHDWRWDTGTLRSLIEQHGVEFPEVSLDTVSRCMDAFVAGSQKIRVFINESQAAPEHHAELAAV